MPVGGLRSILGTLHLIALYLVATVLQGVCVCVLWWCVGMCMVPNALLRAAYAQKEQHPVLRLALSGSACAIYVMSLQPALPVMVNTHSVTGVMRDSLQVAKVKVSRVPCMLPSISPPIELHMCILMLCLHTCYIYIYIYTHASPRIQDMVQGDFDMVCDLLSFSYRFVRLLHATPSLLIGSC